MKLVAIMLAMALLVGFTPLSIRAATAETDVSLFLTGDVRRPDGHRLSYAVTMFRYVPHDRSLTLPEKARATVFVATCTLTDDTQQRHVTAQRFGRAGVDRWISGGYNANVKIADWTLLARTVRGVESMHVTIADPNLHLELDARGTLTPGAPFVPPMPTVGSVDGRGVRGTSIFVVDTRPETVDGTIGNRMLAVIHITGDRGVHTIRLTRFNDDDSQTRVTMIDPNGRITRFQRDDVRMSSWGNFRWSSSKTAFVYPTIWALTIVPLGVFVSLSPAMTDEEFVAIPVADSFWEGTVLVQPLDPAHQVFGRGVLTVTGRRHEGPN